ncbi:hypothetical protein LWI28_020670 [Acer negundo]|uniref:Chromo domain-containing protein n=1 Tax=Acer negundo TaxID=4023 RepID=A0AAD5JDP7_ACENE|nr:hypothetical protein LWI28_020670 [Acer negundo]
MAEYGRGNHSRRARNYVTHEMFQALQDQLQNLTTMVAQVVNIIGNGNGNNGIYVNGAEDEISPVSKGENQNSNDDGSNLVESETQCVGRYVHGLRLAIQDQVSLHHPFKVNDAYQLAFKIEAQLNRGSSKKLGTECSSGEISKANNSTQGGRIAAITHPTTNSGGVTQLRNNTQGQGAIKCYRCSELGHRYNECLKRKTGTRVNLVENDDDEEQEMEEEESLYEEDKDNDSEEEGIEAIEVNEVESGIAKQIPANEAEVIEAVIQVREMKTRAGSYVRFLVKWIGRLDCENSWISEEEFMKIDTEKCQALKMATCVKSSSF